METLNTQLEKIDLPDLVEETHPLLRTELELFESIDPNRAPQLADALARKCLELNALGLSANQLGLDVRACVIKNNPMLVMFNPKIVYYSPEENLAEEGCLSFPLLVVKVKRSDTIRVRYTLPNGKVTTEKFTGMTARIIQHEVDHLNGIVMMDRASRYHRDKANKDRKLRKRRNG